MRRAVIPISLLAALLMSCGATALSMGAAPPPPIPGMPDYTGELVVRPERTDGPTLELRFPYANRGSTLGWGAMHLWARPGHDHVSVTALVDAPSEHPRWRSCDAVDLRIGRRVERIEAEYVGRPMGEAVGHYDAVQLRMTVLTMRKIAGAPRVTGIACGDPFEITREQQESFERFVEWFDHLATPAQLRDPPWYREVGPRPELMPLEDDGEEFMEG